MNSFPAQSTTIAREGNVDSPGACASRGEDGTTVAGANTPPPRSIGWNNGGRKFKALGYLQRRGLYYRRTRGFWANLTMTQNEH